MPTRLYIMYAHSLQPEVVRPGSSARTGVVSACLGGKHGRTPFSAHLSRSTGQQIPHVAAVQDAVTEKQAHGKNLMSALKTLFPSNDTAPGALTDASLPASLQDIIAYDESSLKSVAARFQAEMEHLTNLHEALNTVLEKCGDELPPESQFLQWLRLNCDRTHEQVVEREAMPFNAQQAGDGDTTFCTSCEQSVTPEVLVEACGTILDVSTISSDEQGELRTDGDLYVKDGGTSASNVAVSRKKRTKALSKTPAPATCTPPHVDLTSAGNLSDHTRLGASNLPTVVSTTNNTITLQTSAPAITSSLSESHGISSENDIGVGSVLTQQSALELESSKAEKRRGRPRKSTTPASMTLSADVPSALRVLDSVPPSEASWNTSSVSEAEVLGPDTKTATPRRRSRKSATPTTMAQDLPSTGAESLQASGIMLSAATKASASRSRSRKSTTPDAVLASDSAVTSSATRVTASQAVGLELAHSKEDGRRQKGSQATQSEVDSLSSFGVRSATRYPTEATSHQTSTMVELTDLSHTSAAWLSGDSDSLVQTSVFAPSGSENDSFADVLLLQTSIESVEGSATVTKPGRRGRRSSKTPVPGLLQTAVSCASNDTATGTEFISEAMSASASLAAGSAREPTSISVPEAVDATKSATKRRRRRTKLEMQMDAERSVDDVPSAHIPLLVATTRTRSPRRGLTPVPSMDVHAGGHITAAATKAKSKRGRPRNSMPPDTVVSHPATAAEATPVVQPSTGVAASPQQSVTAFLDHIPSFLPVPSRVSTPGQSSGVHATASADAAEESARASSPTPALPDSGCSLETPPTAHAKAKPSATRRSRSVAAVTRLNAPVTSIMDDRSTTSLTLHQAELGYKKRKSSIARPRGVLSREEERELTTICQDYINLQIAAAALRRVLKRSPSKAEMARAIHVTEAELIQRLDRGLDAKIKLVEFNRGLILKLASQQYHTNQAAGKQMSLHDLIAEGTRGFLHALRKFEPGSGNKLSTYVTNWIKLFMQRASAKEVAVIKLTAPAYEAGTRAMRLMVTMAQRNGGVQPTEEELAAELGWSVSRVKDAINAHKLFRSSISANSVESALYDDDAESSLSETLSSEDICDDASDVASSISSARDQNEQLLLLDLQKMLLEATLQVQGPMKTPPELAVEIMRKRFGLTDTDLFDIQALKASLPRSVAAADPVTTSSAEFTTAGSAVQGDAVAQGEGSVQKISNRPSKYKSRRSLEVSGIDVTTLLSSHPEVGSSGSGNGGGSGNRTTTPDLNLDMQSLRDLGSMYNLSQETIRGVEKRVREIVRKQHGEELEELASGFGPKRTLATRSAGGAVKKT